MVCVQSECVFYSGNKLQGPKDGKMVMRSMGNFCFYLSLSKLGTVAHTSKPNIWEVEQEDQEFSIIPKYIAS